MTEKGKIIAVMPERGGTSTRTNQEWKVQEYVIETFDQFPRKIAFEVFGTQRIAEFNIKNGEVMEVYFDIDASEYNGRWYNRIRAWKIDRNVHLPEQAAPQAAAPAPTTAPTPAPSPSFNDSEPDLPF